jgi:hypothetical protein
MAKKPDAKAPAARKPPANKIYDPETVFAHVCEQLALGRSLWNICTTDPGMPDHMRIRQWIREDKPKGAAERYKAAREAGYSVLAEEILDLSDKTHEWVMVQKTDRHGNLMFDGNGAPIVEKRLISLSSDTVAHKRIQVDTRKWYLSKVLPKIYGDKVTQEITGADGGPISVASVNLKNLSDEELAQMQALMTKAAGKKG